MRQLYWQILVLFHCGKGTDLVLLIYRTNFSEYSFVDGSHWGFLAVRWILGISSFSYSAVLRKYTSKHLVTALNWSGIISMWAELKRSYHNIAWVVTLRLSAINLGTSLICIPFRWHCMEHSKWFCRPLTQIALFIIKNNFWPLWGSW